MTDYSKNDVKNSVLTENTAQSVYKHLRHLKSNRADVVSRWIWELLQNARDASSGDGHLVAAVERQSDSITFQHNGRGFREKEIAHLIYHGSTKSEDASSLGQFGSGFLTTHLLSPRIEVSGYLDEALADDDEEHVSTDPVNVVDVAYFVKDRIGIMARVPDSPRRAVLLWRFLTEYMIPRDLDSIEANEANCECGEMHSYYPAAWLKPLVRNKWVPLRGKKHGGRPTAQSLAKLLSDERPSGTGVGQNDNAMRLLNALGVTQLELTMASIADSDEKKRLLDADLARILTSTEGDLAPVNRFVEDMRSDDGLLEHLEERRERLRSIHRNQKLGAIVECLVKESLETEGFGVRRTGIGSDYEIEHDALDEASGEELGIELAGDDGRTWLVEIKATQGHEVRMTPAQAKTAIKRGDQFLLCVVPVDVESADIDVDRVRVAMRFVAGIGQDLGAVCDDLDDVEKKRQAATENESAQGVRLEILRGKARICVEEALWRDAIPLDGLVAALGHSAG